MPIALLLLSVAGFLRHNDEVFLKALVTTVRALTPGAAHDALTALTTVKQYNKMDLPDSLPVPRFEATAVTGGGVFETLRAICKLVTNKR